MGNKMEVIDIEKEEYINQEIKEMNLSFISIHWDSVGWVLIGGIIFLILYNIKMKSSEKGWQSV